MPCSCPTSNVRVARTGLSLGRDIFVQVISKFSSVDSLLTASVTDSLDCMAFSPLVLFMQTSEPGVGFRN